MSRRSLAIAAIFALLSSLLASCWDKAEMNELALVSMVGLDRDPDSGLYTVWMQIINPASGSSAQKMPGGEQAPVYTYKVSARSFAETQLSIYKLMPRKMFVHHAKAIILSERTARRGMRDFLNFTELMPDARSSVPLLIADGPLEDVMHTFTPLERNPADSIASRLQLLYELGLMSGRRIEIRDVIERSAKREIIVLPLVAPTARQGDPNSWQVNAEIDASINQLKVGGGAVIRDYRMIGRLSDKELVLYNLLNGSRGRFVRRYPFRDGHITVNMKSRRVQRKLEWRDGKPFVRVRIRLDISTLTMSEFHPQTMEEVRELERHVSRCLADELTAFLESARGKGWDLLRVRGLLRRKAPKLADLDKIADEAEIGIEVESRITGMGNLSRLYDGTGGER